MDESQIEQYHRDGYVLVRNVFAPEELLALRERCLPLCGCAKRRAHLGDTLSVGELEAITVDRRLVAIAKALLGPAVVYFGDSSLCCGPNRLVFHKDARSDPEDPSRTPYPILRLALYLQDHHEHSGGLKVRRGSHRHVPVSRANVRRCLCGELRFAALRIGRSVNIRSRVGDVVVWNLRTDHTGSPRLLRPWPALACPPWVDRRLPRRLTLPEHARRLALFCSYGAPSAALERYIANRALHPNNRAFFAHSRFDDPAVRALCRERGVDLRFDALEAARAREAPDHAR